MPLISIIIPAYNTARYIHRPIESSLRQTHSNIEVIVIDDGSTDDTLRVAQSFADMDKRVRVYHQMNAGVSVARNHGVREARGEYLMFLDSDDWLEDNTAEVLLGLQLKNPGKLIASWKYPAYFGDDGKIFRITEKPRMTPRIINSVEEAVTRCWGAASLTSACFKIFSADIIRNGNIHFREGIHNHEDGLFVLDYLYVVGGFVYTDKALWNVLRHSDSSTKSYSFRMAESAIEADNIMMNYPSNTPSTREFFITYHAVCMMNFLYKAVGFGAYDDAKFLKGYLRKYTLRILVSKYAGMNVKLKFLRAVLLPPRVQRVISVVKNMLASLFGRQKKETGQLLRD